MKYQIIPVTHYQQNCALVWCSQTLQAAVIDPGGDIPKILRAVEDNHLTLRKIILTHGHMDHCGGTELLSRELKLPVEGPHRGDAFWIEALDAQAKMMRFSPVRSFTPDRWLDDGDIVEVGEQKLSVLHCPGHTPGHVVFFHKQSKMAFVGDVLFKGSIGRTDFPRGNLEQLIASIRGKLWPLGDEVRFNPGHGPMSTFGEERRNNSFVADSQFG